MNTFLDKGHIQPNCSPCASPTFIITKKESDVWILVINYRVVNKETVKNQYPFPRIEDLLHKLRGVC